MDFVLEDVDKFHLNDYVLLESLIDSSKYMSRTRPYKFETKTKETLFWKYIKVDVQIVGVVWLEKESESDTVATLGIFIASKDKRAKGLGSSVITEAIKQSKLTLIFNKVELRVRALNTLAFNCYKKCGFHETDRIIKKKDNEDEPIVTILMERTV